MAFSPLYDLSDFTMLKHGLMEASSNFSRHVGFEPTAERRLHVRATDEQQRLWLHVGGSQGQFWGHQRKSLLRGMSYYVQIGHCCLPVVL